MAKLTYKEREKLPSEVFALPKERKYPLTDEDHGRVALSRASAFASPPERKIIDAKVHKKFPSIK